MNVDALILGQLEEGPAVDTGALLTVLTGLGASVPRG
ncbi:hypothetical protein BVI1335_1030002 [Burkholderia vietnamiensis]|nr:hypothetical protein BVI1335_1030002 [Burkholderia vietnamiensis]